MAVPPSLSDIRATLDRLAAVHPGDEELATARQWIADLIDAESTRYSRRSGDDFRSMMRRDLGQQLHDLGIKSGRICEIGGVYKSLVAEIPGYDVTFMSLYPDDEVDNVLVTDATQADHLDAEQFDAIFSTSVSSTSISPGSRLRTWFGS